MAEQNPWSNEKVRVAERWVRYRLFKRRKNFKEKPNWFVSFQWAGKRYQRSTGREAWADARREAEVIIREVCVLPDVGVNEAELTEDERLILRGIRRDYADGDLSADLHLQAIKRSGWREFLDGFTMSDGLEIPSIVTEHDKSIGGGWARSDGQSLAVLCVKGQP